MVWRIRYSQIVSATLKMVQLEPRVEVIIDGKRGVKMIEEKKDQCKQIRSMTDEDCKSAIVAWNKTDYETMTMIRMVDG